jgi:hypothetical protein
LPQVGGWSSSLTSLCSPVDREAVRFARLRVVEDQRNFVELEPREPDEPRLALSLGQVERLEHAAAASTASPTMRSASA